MVTESVSEPSVSVSADVISRPMAVSSVPAASSRTRVGVSASAASDTCRVPVVVATEDSPTSVESAVTDSEKSSSLSAGGTSVMLSSTPLGMVAEPLTTGIWIGVPSSALAKIVAPSGISEMITDSTSLLSVRAAVISRSTAVSSVPLASLSTSVGASASSPTATFKTPVTDALSPSSSVAVAVTASEKSEALLSGGVMVRPES